MALSIKDEDQIEYEWDMSLLAAQVDILKAVRREMAEDHTEVVDKYLSMLEDEVSSLVGG